MRKKRKAELNRVAYNFLIGQSFLQDEASLQQNFFNGKRKDRYYEWI